MLTAVKVFGWFLLGPSERTMTTINKRALVIACLTSALLTGLIASSLAIPFEGDVMQSNYHRGRSFHWTVLSFTGFGLVVGVVVGNATIILLRFLDNPNGSRSDSD